MWGDALHSCVVLRVQEGCNEEGEMKTIVTRMLLKVMMKVMNSIGSGLAVKLVSQITFARQCRDSSSDRYQYKRELAKRHNVVNDFRNEIQRMQYAQKS